MVEMSARERLNVFEEVFGESILEIDKDLVHYMRRVR